MKLSNRLETILSMVPEVSAGAAVADVGTDHGFVPIRLVQDRKAERALAMDVRPGPLARAKEHIAVYGLEDRIETRLSDGLAKLNPGDAEGVVIAGMGGELMLRILKDGAHVRDSIRFWVLSPQSEPALFRHGLEELGLCIIRERMLLEEGKFYAILLVRPGSMHYEKKFMYRFGQPDLWEDRDVMKAFLEKEKRQLTAVLEKTSAQEGVSAASRSAELREELKEIEEAYEVLQ